MEAHPYVARFGAEDRLECISNTVRKIGPRRRRFICEEFDVNDGHVGGLTSGISCGALECAAAVGCMPR